MSVSVHMYTTNMSDNSFGAGNQQGSPRDPSETTRRAPTDGECKAYLQGALHDGTYNRLHKTHRISQNNKLWLLKLQKLLQHLGYKSWLYREGRDRNVYALETAAKFLNMHFDPSLLKRTSEKLAYVRGYFDAEGGIPHSLHAPLYIQLCQKNRTELQAIQSILEAEQIACGKLHNPSKRVDPHYWRFFISRKSHNDFMKKVHSWHPRKQRILDQRMKI